MTTRHRLALLILPTLAWVAPSVARGDEIENWQRLRSMPREQRQLLSENLKKFDTLDPARKPAIRELDAQLAKLPAENRMNYYSVLRRYHLWVQGLPEKDQEALRAAAPEQRMALVRKLRAEKRSAARSTTPLFLQIYELNAPSPFEAADRLKKWFALTPQQREEIEREPPQRRRDRLTELGAKLKVSATQRLTKAEEEDELIKCLQAYPMLKERLNRIGELKKKAEDDRRKVADNFYFIQHPPEKVNAEDLMRFDAALPSWYRSPFDHLPPDEAKRRLTILYRLVYPAPAEIPADLKAATAPASAPASTLPKPRPAAPTRPPGAAGTGTTSPY